MNPIELSGNLKQTLRSYLTTIFNVNRDGTEMALANAIEESFDIEGALSKGPYLEITPPYATGLSLSDLVAEGILCHELIELPEDNLPFPTTIPLYVHQEQAIRKLVSGGRNIVMSSGTGSGKTEGFLIPILNDLLLDPTSGVRALLIYPLNALVNDQLDRLRTLLKGTDITFGRYTSELETSLKYARLKYPNAPDNEVIARDQIRSGEKIPQILITNYAMLEYLLLRPEDSRLFQDGLWRFIVLDEAHTYSGAQGIEVSMLLRRLKHRLGKTHGEVQCIATSATLTNDNASEAVDFAKNLFDEEFDEDDIIFGEINPDYVPLGKPYTVDAQVYLHKEFEELIGEIRHAEQSTENIALHMQDIGLIPPSINWSSIAEDNLDTPHRFVWEIMRNNNHLISLREWMLSNREEPIALEKVAEKVFGSELQTNDDQKIALYHLVELGAIARPKQDAAPLLPARYHMFMRSPQGVWACMNPDCSGQDSSSDSGWSRVFSMRRETCDSCGCKVYPITVCRECGQVYVKTQYSHGQYLSEPAPEENDLTPDYETRYFTWKALEEDRALGIKDESESTENEDDSVPDKYDMHNVEICLRCGFQVRQCQCDEDTNPAYVILKMVQINQGKKDAKRFVPYEFMNECPRCRSTAQKDTEIVTPISVSGTGPLSIITYELYRRLPTSTKTEILKKPGQGRKLLTFYDSRQGAARFASYLQFTVNTENYRHIIPTVIHNYLHQKEYAPNLKTLTEYARNLAWTLQIFHNDSDTTHWRQTVKKAKPRKRQRDELDKKISTQILGEITTGRLRRQSLESLGLVAIHYFDDSEPDYLPDFERLATQLNLTTAQTRNLVEYFLDDLRKRKVVEFPDGVDASDLSFGNYEGHPTLVRGNPQKYTHQQPWIGKTERHSRYRYMEKILKANHLPHDNHVVKQALNHMFDWLIDTDNEIMVGSPEEGYRIDYEILIFDTQSQWYQCKKCQRFNAHGNHLPCPQPYCGGALESVDIDVLQADNFFYQSFVKDVVPIRVEEHTAQLESSKGREYQENFKSGDINVLSCSTTFEMGIDLGDLQAVVMSNIPPTVANYRQRAGRAGRRAGGAAFILTWAADRPHDQTYFRNPPDIISGQVRIPYIAVDNLYIQRRHINAILLSEFLRYRGQAGATDWKTIGAFFDNDYGTNDPHLNHLESWLKNRHAQIENSLKNFEIAVEEADIDQRITNFQQDIQRVYETYKYVSDYYIQQLSIFKNKLLGDVKKYGKAIQNYDNLLNRLRKEPLINYFSNHGILPSYSFPLNSVELRLPPGQRDTKLRLQRDLKVAIREYAPGSEIVADKRVWRSDGIQFHRDTVKDREYRICEACNHLQISRDAGIPLESNNGECPVCGTLPNARRRKALKFIIPDGFYAGDKDNGKPARQYVRSEPSLMKSALFPSNMINTEQISRLVSNAYDREGKLLYVNEGDVRTGGFYIQLNGEHRGELVKTKKDRKNMSPVSLGHERTTNTLHLSFHDAPSVNVPSPDNMSFWISLMYALIQGASRALQIERNDIDGVLFPRREGEHNDWDQTIVLYDNVPGGAGHVRQIQKEFTLVIREALKIANCTDCSPETSCYHCLRDYNNQLYHHMLRRGDIVRFLEAILHSLPESDSELPNVGTVTAINQPLWLMQQVENAKTSVQISADSLTLQKPIGALRNWADLLQDLLRRKVNVTLCLKNIEIDKNYPETLSVGRHLQVLQDNGLTLQQINNVPEWQFLIDVERDDLKRAVRVEGACRLDRILGEGITLHTTTHDDGMALAQHSYGLVVGTSIDSSQLEPPSSVQVINYNPHSMGSKSERDLFADVFASPIREIYVNDGYLYNRERIVVRLGAYIQLAHEQGALERVIVTTHLAGKKPGTGKPSIQKSEFEKLEGMYPDVSIKFKRSNPQHDRYITLTRTDGTKARILIGQGLDFIQSNGRNKQTYIVIEDPYSN